MDYKRPDISFKEGKVVAGAEPFYESPFILDHIFDSANANKPEPLFIRPYDRAGQAITFNDALFEKSYRFLITGKSTLRIIVNDLISGEAPMVWLYDYSGKLIAVARDLDNNKLREFYIKEPGYYRILLRFKPSKLSSIMLVLDDFQQQVSKEGLVRAYANLAMKSIEIKISPQQLANLMAVRARQEKHWNTARKPDLPSLNFPSYRDKVIARIRSPKGTWSIAELDLAGRNEAHKSKHYLPSLSVNILSGELIYGLKQFKLYILDSKEFGRDMLLESILKDYGQLIPRHDFAKVFLNGRFVSFMEIAESVDTHMFEYAQKLEGPILGFDADDLLAENYNNRFTQRAFYKPKTFKLNENVDITSASFSEHICKDSMQLLTSFAMAYTGSHGMNQTDLRYYFNSRKNCFEPMLRDFNSTVGRIVNGEPTLLMNSIMTLSTLSPEWRPNVASHASGLLLINEKNRSLDGFSWWSVMPATMNFFANPNNLNGLFEYFFLWEMPSSLSMINNRFVNFSYISRKLRLVDTPLPLELIQVNLRKMYWVFKSPKNFLGSGNLRSPLESSLSDSAIYISELVNKASSGVVRPSLDSLKILSWRNKLVASYLTDNCKKSLLKNCRDVDYGVNVDSLPSLITFLYRHEGRDLMHLFYVERLIAAKTFTSGDFYLQDIKGRSIRAKKVFKFGDNSKGLHPSKQDIYLSEIFPGEQVLVYYFQIPKAGSYNYLSPVLKGSKQALLTREILVTAREPIDNQNKLVSDLTQWFKVSGFNLFPKSDSLLIKSPIHIPSSYHLIIDKPTTFRFAKNGCMRFDGDLEMESGASLDLKPITKSWQGVHFHNNLNLVLKNISMSGVGNGSDFVYCLGQKYTGALSVFYSRVSIFNLKISDTNTEDALHLVKSKAIISNIAITGSQSDAIDSDFSVIAIDKSAIGNNEGDAVDLSGSHAVVFNSRLYNNADKAVSAGENSVVKITQSMLLDSYYGVAAKDSSVVTIDRRTVISGCKQPTATYIKKAYYTEPKIIYVDK